MARKEETQKLPQEFIGYEEARKDKRNEPVVPVTMKEVKAALNKINPDEESMKSRG
jgi:hypothetical protein